MIAVTAFAGRTVAVFGLARSGISAALALKAGGAKVLAWDDKEPARGSAHEAGVVTADWRFWHWPDIAALVLSPGVPLTHPQPHEIVFHAQAAGAEIIGDLELFFRTLRPEPNARGVKIVAVSGTNGKSTTTALIGHILASCGYATQTGGNIGRPALDLDPPVRGQSNAYVLEVSSYQIDLTPSLLPDVAVLTNITPDHLDRHGGMAGYVDVKARLFARQGAGDVAVAGVDDAHSEGIAAALAGRGGPALVPVSVGKTLGRGVYVLGGQLFDALSGPAQSVTDLKPAPALQGAHNWQNAALAYAATRPLVRDGGAIAAAIARFPGLKHRMEEVGRAGKVRFVNDSKATNADAASKALACFADIHWIAGGVAKEGGIHGLEGFYPRIAKAYLIGQAADAFAATLEGAVPYARCGDLATAVRQAAADAARSPAAAPVVLLSPACASFDQFKDYEERGDRFRALAAEFAAVTPKGAAA